MDLLIKGMEKKDYPQTITINPDGTVIKDTFGLHRNVDEWKAVWLEPHGRLGDLDKAELDYKATTAKCVDSDPQRKKGYLEAERLVLKILQKTPTIVEAST